MRLVHAWGLTQSEAENLQVLPVFIFASSKDSFTASRASRVRPGFYAVCPIRFQFQLEQPYDAYQLKKYIKAFHSVEYVYRGSVINDGPGVKRRVL